MKTTEVNGSGVRKMREPDLIMTLSGDGDGHPEMPGDATIVAANPSAEVAAIVAANGSDAADGVATSRPGAAVTMARSAAQFAACWYRAGVADATRHGGLAHTAWQGHGPSLAGISAYAKGRGWLPDGHPGGRVVTGVPLAYYRTAAPLAVAVALAWIWVWSRLLRLSVTVLVTGIVVILVACT